MAKRAKPYTEDFIPQSKVYIGLKQFNNNEDRLKKVYEKTLDLLFKGAKKTPHPSDIATNGERKYVKKDRMKQLFIDKDGSITHTGHMIEGKSQSKQCQCNGTIEFQCAYCDTMLCGMCQLSCAKCDKVYCNKCMLLGPEGDDVCLSCYS